MASLKQQSFFSLMPSLIVALLLGLLFGCDQTTTTPTDTSSKESKPSTPKPISELTREAWNLYHIHGVHSFSQPVECIANVKKTVVALIKEPHDENLTLARSELDKCKTVYQQTHAFIAANDSAQNDLNKFHSRIDSPLEMPGFIDSVQGYPFSGIINDASMTLSKDELLRQHGLTDSSDVSLGFSVIAFILWGESKYNDQLAPRTIEDFEMEIKWQPKDHELGLNELDIQEHSNNRRRRYLELALLILESDLNQLASIWNKNTLPPLNKARAKALKEDILRALNQTTTHPKKISLETLLPLLVDKTTAANELAATEFSQWLDLNNKDSFASLLNDETPDNNKQTTLSALFSTEQTTP